MAQQEEQQTKQQSSSNRRSFLAQSALGLLGAAALPQALAQTGEPAKKPLPPGAPPAFGTAPETGPHVTAQTFAEAEKLVQVENSAAHRAEAAQNWQRSMAGLYERRTGPRKVELPDAGSPAPAAVWNPLLPGQKLVESAQGDSFEALPASTRPLPKADSDIAFATIPELASWIKTKKLSSQRLTRMYLERLARYTKELNCVITLTADSAREQALRADAMLAFGNYRGPLHGIPWGAKDLLDTAGIRTTYGAAPFRDRVPKDDAAVVERLHDAGAVLVAKLSLGALALNDIWFGGQTKNPWLLQEGSSGSSAGPGAAVAAGLVGFAIGSETEGSIVSPSSRCGVTGLRPTFGRVPRNGAMALAWSLDKLGPMARGVEDTMLVLKAISGPDQADPSSVPSTLKYNAQRSVQGLKLGYFPKWLHEAPATEVDRAAFEQCKKLGMQPVEVSLPDWPYGNLNLLLFAEAAASFEQLVLSGKVDQLTMQVPDAWPNSFRQARFLSAVDYVQADRMRRLVAEQMARVMGQVDLLLVPSLRDEMLTITNFTGHPALTLRAGFVEVSQARSDWAPDPAHPLPKFSKPRRVPYDVTFIGQLFDEGTITNAGLALEKAMNVAQERPKGFA